MKSWRELWVRQRRSLRRRRFAAGHELNVLLWTVAGEEYFAEMAVRGPWAGLCEDLADASPNRENTRLGPSKGD